MGVHTGRSYIIYIQPKKRLKWSIKHSNFKVPPPSSGKRSWPRLAGLRGWGRSRRMGGDSLIRAMKRERLVIGNWFWKKRKSLDARKERGKDGFGNSQVPHQIPTVLCVRRRHSGKGGKRMVRSGEETRFFCYIIQKYPAVNANLIICPGKWWWSLVTKLSHAETKYILCKTNFNYCPGRCCMLGSIWMQFCTLLENYE